MGYNLVSINSKVYIPYSAPPDFFIPKLLEKLNYYLKEKSYIHNIFIKENYLKFLGPPFRFAWNGFVLFNPISNGEFWITLDDRNYWINYRIFFWEFFVYSLLFSTISIFGMFPSTGFRFLYLLLVWSFFIFNTVWVKNRLENFLEKLSEQITEEYMDYLRQLKGDAEG